jgi:class 3 adenylate cyclase
MPKKSIFSLRVKLALFTIILIASVGAIVMAVTADKMRLSLSTEIKEKGIAIAKNIARSSEDVLVGEGDELYLFQFISSSMNNRGVSYIQIVDSSGVVRAHSDIKKSGIQFQPWPGLKGLEEGDGYVIQEAKGLDGYTLYDISVPITLTGAEKQTLGQVHLGLSSAVIEEAASKVRRTVGGVALIGLLLGGIGAFTLAKITFSPINELMRGVNEIGRGNLDQKIEVKRVDEIGELTVAFNDMARGLREKELIKDSFARYMSKELADKLLGDPEHTRLQLGGEHRYVSVLFTDIRGFTSMSEKLDPKGVISFLNEYFSMMVDIVFENGGFIDKFIGDALMVIYGVPVKADDDAVRCIRTAIRMRDAMRLFNDRRVKAGFLPVHIGIGINSGTVVAGNVGSQSRMNYTVVGDAVNLAARLVPLSREENIIISEETFRLVAGQFEIEKKDKVMIKGKNEPQQVYEVTGEKPRT